MEGSIPMPIEVTENFAPQDPMGFVDIISEENMIGGRPSRPMPPMPIDPVTFPICEKEFIGPALTIQSTAARGSHVFTCCPLAHLQKLINGLHPGFRDARWKSIQVRIQPTAAMATLRGAVRIAYTPVFTPVRYAGAANIGYDLMRYSTVDNVVMPFSQETDTVVDIPMVYYAPFWNLTKSAGIEAPTGLYIGIDQSLGNADNVACSATFQIYFKFVGLEFYTPSFTSVDSPTPAAYTASSGTPVYSKVDATAYGRVAEAANKSKQGVISGVAETVAKASSLAATVDPTGAAAAVSSVATAVGAAASLLGLDKPTSLDFPSYCQLRIGDHLVQPSGLDPSLVANVGPDITDTVDHAIFTENQDSGNLASLCSKWSIHSTGEVTSGALPGHVITADSINPCNKLGSPAGIYAPNVAFYSSFFSHWRGDLRFRFTMHQDCFFKGKLYLAYFPLPSLPVPASITPAQLNLVRYAVMSVVGPHVVEFTIPYHALTEWDSTSLYFTDTKYAFAIGLMEPARRQGVVTGFEWTLEIAATDEPGKYEVAEPEAWAPAKAYGIVGSQSRPLGPIGETAITPVTTLTPLLKRYCYQGTIPAGPLMSVVPTLGIDPFHSLVLSTFCAFRGSLRYTLYMPPNTHMRGTFKNTNSSQDPTRSKAGSQCGHTVKYQDYNPEVPLEFHFTQQTYYYPISAGASISTHNWFEFGLYNADGTPNTTKAIVYYMSVGDDFIYGVRRPLPVIYPV